MIPRQSRLLVAGFTLIEVIVAMFVIAIGMGALLSALTASAESVGRLRDKSFAEWVALNRITETRLANPRPGVGETSGEIEFANIMWQWKQKIIDPDVQGILRIDVAVARVTAASKKAAATDEEFPAAARAYGFLGTKVGRPSGSSPAWSWPPLRNPGTP
ncbi:MAG: type II secretion system minor pseudopilin GspI [Steroidobacteraceae bacterium]